MKTKNRKLEQIIEANAQAFEQLLQELKLIEREKKQLAPARVRS